MQLEQCRSRVWNILRYVHRAEVPTRAASVSYFAMLASVPLLAIVLTFGAQLLPHLAYHHSVGVGDLTSAELKTTLARVLPGQAHLIIRHEIERIQSEPPVGLLSVGLILSLWTAATAYMAMNNAMFQIYGKKETRPYWKVRLTAMLMPILFGLIFVGALAAIVVAPMVIDFLGLDGFAGAFTNVAQWVGLFVIVLLGFELAYRFGPERHKKRPRISYGAIAGAVLFLAFSLVFQAYVQNFGSYDKVYGSLGGAIVFLVWIWMSSTCLLVGCAVNKCMDDECTCAEHPERQGQVQQRQMVPY